MELKKIDIDNFIEFFNAVIKMPKFNPNLNKAADKSIYNYQIDIIKQVEINNYNIIGKSRQMGISTLFQIYIAYQLLHNPKINIAIISPTRNTSTNFIERVKYILQFQFFVTNNKSKIKIRNGATLQMLNQISYGKLETIDMLLVDEAAYCNLNDSWNLIIPNLVASAKFILYSSETNKCSKFNDIWINKNNKYNNFNRILCLYNNLFGRINLKEIYDGNCKYYLADPFPAELEHLKSIISEEAFNIEYGFKHQFKDLDVIDSKNKSYNINIRLPYDLYSKLPKENISEYIRKLIDKDLNS